MCPAPPEDTWPVPFLSCPLLTKNVAYRLCELIQSCLSKPLQGQSWAQCRPSSDRQKTPTSRNPRRCHLRGRARVPAPASGRWPPGLSLSLRALIRKVSIIHKLLVEFKHKLFIPGHNLEGKPSLCSGNTLVLPLR